MTKHTKLFCLSLAVALMCRTVTAGDHATTDITTCDGKTYKNATVERAEPNGVLLTYCPEGGGIGMAKVKFAVLPEALQREYNYDVQKAAAFEAAQAQAQVALQVRLWADYRDATNRLAKRLAREEAEALADQKAAEAKLRAQTQPARRSGWGGGGGGGGGGGNLDAAVAGFPVPYAQTPDAIAKAKPVQRWSQTASQGEVNAQRAMARVYVLRPLPGQSQSPANGQVNQQATPTQLPEDVVRQLQQQAAERGVAIGSPGSPNANAWLQQALQSQSAPPAAAPVRRK